MSIQTPAPIFLDVKPRTAIMVNVLLTYIVSLDLEDNIYILRIGDMDDKVKVSPKCLDQLRLIIHQLRLYQQTGQILKTLPKSKPVDDMLILYISFVGYLAQIVSAFHAEAKADPSSSTNKWRSAYLEYHIALALYDNAFTEEKQTAALNEMKRTWVQFKEKKGFKKVQDLTGERLHNTFCIKGNNLCGGSFEHEKTVDDMISETLKRIGVDKPEDMTKKARTAAAAVDLVDQSSQHSISTRPRARTTQSSAQSQASSDVIQHHVEGVDNSLTHIKSDAKKLPKPRRQVRKSKITKVYGKKKASSVPLESEDDDNEAPLVDVPVVGIAEVDDEGYDRISLPPILEGWETWTRTAFEHGNSRVFLKLASWMLVRFRQLTDVDLDSDVDGLVIPGNPRTMVFDNDDHFFEAVGMERLYTAIVHMETRPRFLSHMFHALGKDRAIHDSGPAALPQQSMQTLKTDNRYDSWAGITHDTDMEVVGADDDAIGSDDDAVGSPDLEATDVAQALDSMAIDEMSTALNNGTRSVITRLEKRKRTLSHVSPPKKDGGRGPVKRAKDGIACDISSASPVQSSIDFDGTGFISSSSLPESTQISQGSSVQDNGSVIIDAWDDIPIVEENLNSPTPVVLVRGTPSPNLQHATITTPIHTTHTLSSTIEDTIVPGRVQRGNTPVPEATLSMENASVPDVPAPSCSEHSVTTASSKPSDDCDIRDLCFYERDAFTFC
ncbi:hypothetical protein DFJ58DRAFT_848004 [Suillus subalutaceus]|uniref:uncharacterized protein n=1 Tax=Suillus subalutaceus TaxID=48586 RepID=UPI001B862E14|nr:uncharacterized protein DFJ58DRAFT_848004 [Suillus subalutaceus]KAG1832553.1 hypothetical protein DFJ58DRAFT_848004 [Suillus subalutaceus]